MVRSRSGGCLKVILIIIGILVLLAIAGGIVFYKYGGSWLRAGAAEMVRKTSDGMFTEMRLSPEQKKAAMDSVDGLAKKIEDGSISMKQIEVIVKEVTEGPSRGVFLALGFHRTYVEPSALPQEKKKAASDTVNRFAAGISSGKVESAKIEELSKIVFDAPPGGKGDRKKLRQSLRPEEIDECLKLMEGAADAAKVEKNPPPVDVGALIQAAVAKGLQSK